jgi:Xaa-Pro aminopeptidase
MIKSAAEIESVRRACDLGMQGMRHAVQFIRPGVTERTLEAELEAKFKRGGAQRLPFDSIIKSGPNALYPWRILAAHYDRRNRAMQAGELVIFDVGCELDYYGSDMGRTFPVSGKFSAAQKEILKMQQTVMDAIIGAMRPGVTLLECNEAGLAVMPKSAEPYMQVGLFFGHHIGLSMGDPNLSNEPLETGMVITVEPWYYNHDLQVATFLEDVILITPEGNENLTAALPRTVDGLEALMVNPAEGI